MWLPIVGRFEHLFVADRSRLSERYKGNGVENKNVITIDQSNRLQVIADMSRKKDGFSYLEGSMSVGKTTVFTRMLADTTSKSVIVICPTSAHASNAAVTINKMTGEDFAAAITMANSHTKVSSNLVFMAAERFTEFHSSGMRLSDDVAYVLVDESQSTDGHHLAAMQVARLASRCYPVIAMSGTMAGRLPSYNLSKTEVRKYTDLKDAVVGKRLIYCESSDEARDKAAEMNGFYVNKFASYTSMLKLVDRLEHDECVDVFLGPDVSEGLNFKCNVVVDSRLKLQVDVRADELVLVSQTVTPVEHLQRAGRLREGGVYYGHDLGDVLTRVVKREVNARDDATRLWVMHHLGERGEAISDHSKTLSDVMIRDISREVVLKHHEKGYDWYELMPDDKEPDSLLEVPNRPRKGHRRGKRSGEFSSGSSSGSTACNEVSLSTLGLENGGLVHEVVGHDDFRGIPVITGSTADRLDVAVMIDNVRKLPRADMVEWLIQMCTKKGSVPDIDFTMEGMCQLVAVRNHFMWQRVRCKDTSVDSLLRLLKYEFNRLFGHALESKHWPGLWFAYVDYEGSKVATYGSVTFMESCESETDGSGNLFSLVTGNRPKGRYKG